MQVDRGGEMIIPKLLFVVCVVVTIAIVLVVAFNPSTTYGIHVAQNIVTERMAGL